MPIYGQTFHRYSTEENGHELNQRGIRAWKYVRTEINAYLENQVENYSKIDNFVNKQNAKISKSNFSKAWKEKRYHDLDITSQIKLFLILNIVINTVVTRVYNLGQFFFLR